MTKRVVTIDDVFEVNARMAGYFGMEICFANGFMGDDFSIERADQLASVISEVLNGQPRQVFDYEQR